MPVPSAIWQKLSRIQLLLKEQCKSVWMRLALSHATNTVIDETVAASVEREKTECSDTRETHQQRTQPRHSATLQGCGVPQSTSCTVRLGVTRPSLSQCALFIDHTLVVPACSTCPCCFIGVFTPNTLQSCRTCPNVQHTQQGSNHQASISPVIFTSLTFMDLTSNESRRLM